MLDKRARSLVTIMIFIAVSALLLRIAIVKIIESNILQNEGFAANTAKLICAALENYAKDHQGAYPEKFSLLTQPQPPYLDKNYLQAPALKGYVYTCPRLERSGYSCYAAPLKCKISGNKIYSMATGALLVTEECEKKE